MCWCRRHRPSAAAPCSLSVSRREELGLLRATRSSISRRWKTGISKVCGSAAGRSVTKLYFHHWMNFPRGVVRQIVPPV